MTLQALSQWCWVFFIYAFLGWCVEVIFHAVSEGKFINRGFLNGPICPIYGFGILVVVLCLTPVKDNLLYLFFGSVILTSALEFFTGFVLEKFFNDKWWDYSEEPLNIHGYVCIRFSLAWGLACVFTVDVIYPFTRDFISLIPEGFGYVLLCFFIALMLTDLVVTYTETLKLKKTLIFVGNAERGIRRVSDGIGEVLTTGTLNAMEKLGDGREVVEIRKAKAKLGFSAVQKRILNAYPRLKEGRYKENFTKLKARFKTELIRSGRLPALIDSSQKKLPRVTLELYRSSFETVIDVLEARDVYTAGHSRRVAILTGNFCKYLRISHSAADIIELAASVHDLGKVGISDATLNKKEALTDDEWIEIKRHPEIGADIIMKCFQLEQVADIIRCHHEHWDGSGYPNGLSGDAIPKGAQIISICDAVDSMMLTRVYREAVSNEECISEITGSRGRLFCPEYSDVFLANWDNIVSDLYTAPDSLCSERVVSANTK